MNHFCCVQNLWIEAVEADVQGCWRKLRYSKPSGNCLGGRRHPVDW